MAEMHVNQKNGVLTISIGDQMVLSAGQDADGLVKVYVRDKLKEVELLRQSDVPKDGLAQKALRALEASIHGDE